MNTTTRNTLLTYLFLFLTVFLVLFFTKNIYMQTVENKNTLASVQQDLAQKKAEYESLSQMKQDLDGGKYDEYNLDKYLINFSEDELSSYFYNYAATNLGKVQINNITLDAGKINDFGFMEGTIQLSVVFATELDMLNMFAVLLENDTYNFFIHNFDYPFGEITGPFMVDIPLKVLYK